MSKISFKHITAKLLTCALLLTLGIILSAGSSQAKGKYTVKTSTKPCNATYTKVAAYNSKTSQYFMLRSYLEKLESEGGGTLTLKKGTYKIPCTLYIPSNVTIKLKNGVVLKKTAKTGTKKLAAGSSLFELVPPSKSVKKNGVKKYAGSKKVTISGAGNATINLNKVANSSGIVVGHAKNITISGITFKNMNGNSFINVAATNNINITGCKFTGATASEAAVSNYAISLEIPDKTTKAFPYTWSKTDKTVNKTVTITGNTFSKIISAVGSNKYTENVYHSIVNLTGNTFSELSDNAVRLLNWESANISSNKFKNIASGTGSFCGILASGAKSPVFSGNTFDYVAVPIKLLPATNTGNGSKYAVSYNNVLPADFVTGLQNNTVTNAQIYYVINQTSTAPESAMRLAYYMDYTTKDYTITAGSRPYHDYYTDNVWYNDYTKDYYVFKSYLDQLERVGGGTLTVESGNYSITNTLFVPSSTTIIFHHGVNITKGSYTGFDSKVLAPSQSIFQLIPPSLGATTGAVGGYNGAHDISFIGQGAVTIDLAFYDYCKAIVMGHNRNVVIQGITFLNYKGHHFIELDASDNVTIQACTFSGCFPSASDNYKEAINIDTPDRNTGGFNQVWTNFDRTPNNNVKIQNNTFTNVLRAIGSHKYSVSLLDNTTQVYHTGIQILNNNISDTFSYAIRGINWKDCIIKGNTIKNVNAGNTTAILMSGTVNPTITENTIEKAARPITLNSTDNLDSTLADKAYPATHTILDSNKKTGVNLSAMLNNTLIDVTKAQILFYVGGNSKENSTEVKKYNFDSSHVTYTGPTPTPEAEDSPSPAPSESASPSASPSPEPLAPAQQLTAQSVTEEADNTPSDVITDNSESELSVE